MEYCDGMSASCPADSTNASSALGNSVEVSFNTGTGAATISWSAETLPGPFNVYRGALAPTGAMAYTHVCLANGLSGTSVNDATALSPGAGVYYLVSRKIPPCPESSLGSASSGAGRPNQNPCP